MKKNLIVAIRFTLVTTVFFGLAYPLLVTGISQWIFPKQANGSLIVKNGQVIGSRLIAQGFSGDKYFHPRPSAAGTGYDPTASGGSNLGPTNQALVTRVQQDVAKLRQENPGAAIPGGPGDNLGVRAGPGHFAGRRGISGSAGCESAGDQRGGIAADCREAHTAPAVWDFW